MDNDKASDQQELAGVAETTQSSQVKPPTGTSATPVRVRQSRKPRPAPEPVPAPVFIEPVRYVEHDWTFDENPDGRAVAIELSGGTE